MNSKSKEAVLAIKQALNHNEQIEWAISDKGCGTLVPNELIVLIRGEYYLVQIKNMHG